MKKLLLAVTTLLAYQIDAQNYFGTQFIGESGINLPLKLTKTGDKIAVSGYVGGNLTGAFPITFKGGNADGALTSLSPVDGSIQWIKHFGGGGDEVVMDTAIDAAGNYYITGYMNSAGSLAMDADPGPAVYPLPVLSNLTNRDIFIIKLDSNGDFVWAKSMCTPTGFAANDDSAAIELDSQGNIYVAGSFVYVDFDPGVGTQLLMTTGTSDGFIVKLDNNGNFGWVKTLAGTSAKKITDMEIDDNDNIFVTGRFQGTIDLNPDPTLTDIKTRVGGFDTFVAKYTSSGDYVWGHAYGGTGADTPEKIIVSGNNVYVGGAFTGTVDLDPTSGENIVTALAASDSYVSSFTKDGAYNTSFVIPGSTTNSDTVNDIYIDNSGNIYVSGTFQNITVGGNNYAGAAANSDNYFLKLNPNLTFSNIYLVQGTGIQNSAFISEYASKKFIAAGSSRGAASYDYTDPGSTSNPSNATYYSYYTKFDFEPTIVLATSDITRKSKVLLYPNPVKNIANLKSEKSINAVKVYNMEGRNVYSIQRNNITNLDLSILPKGAYILQSTDEKGTSAQTKFIKQ